MLKLRLILLGLAAIWLLPACDGNRQGNPPVTEPVEESDFASGYQKIRIGMSFDEARGLMGPPSHSFQPFGSVSQGESVHAWTKEGSKKAVVALVKEGEIRASAASAAADMEDLTESEIRFMLQDISSSKGLIEPAIRDLPRKLEADSN